MDKLKEKFEEHRKVVIGASIGVLVFVLISVVIVSVRTSLEEKQEEQQQIEQEQAQQQTMSENEKKAQEELNDTQKDQVGKYSEDIQKELAMLKANVWQDSSEKNFVTFGDNFFVESDKDSNGNANTEGTTFVVEDMYEEQLNDLGIQGTFTTLSVSLADGTKGTISVKFVDYTQKAGGVDTKQYSISSNLFKTTQTFTRAKAADVVKIEGLTEDALPFIGNRTDELTQKINDYCSVNQPTTTVVTFSGAVSVSTSQYTYVTNFVCNDKSGTKIQVIYQYKDGNLFINEGSSYATN